MIQVSDQFVIDNSSNKRYRYVNCQLNGDTFFDINILDLLWCIESLDFCNPNFCSVHDAVNINAGTLYGGIVHISGSSIYGIHIKLFATQIAPITIKLSKDESQALTSQLQFRGNIHHSIPTF